MTLAPILFVAFLGGVIPSLLWLTFWLLEDRCQPEPKRMIFYTFVAGMLGVFAVYFPEKAVQPFFSEGAALFLWWALFEELAKFLAVYFVAINTEYFDEPLDAVMYMVTAALGFSALENAIFLIEPLRSGDILKTLLTEDLRFIGATLLHVLSSATIGIMLARAFYKDARAKKRALVVGLILATVLHALFNFFILKGGAGGTLWLFLCIWIGIIATLLLIERVKEPTKDYC